MKNSKAILIFFAGFVFFPVVLFLTVQGVLYFLSNPMTVKPLNPKDRVIISSENLKRHVETLAKTPKPRNSDNIDSLNQAALYIQKEFEKLGLKVSRQWFDAPNGKRYQNLSVLILPNFESVQDDGKNFDEYLKKWPKEQIWVIGAHYDVCWEQPGADDNASGVAGVIELARALVENKPKLKHPVNLVAFTLEEPNYYDTDWMGSLVYAKALKQAQVQVKGMLSVEMIGYFKDEEGSQTYPISMLKSIYPEVGNFVAIVGKTSQLEFNKEIKSSFMRASDLPVSSINAPEFIEGIDYSDHRSFWATGYSAVMVTDTSFFRNHNYHKPTDTPDTLDFNRMADVVRGLYQSVMANP